MLRDNESKKDKQASISDVDKNFLSQVQITHVPDWNPDLVKIDFKKCDILLAKGANINARFGKYGMNDHDACSFCGPNDTPLTHAVKRNHAELTNYLLKNGADTELLNGSDETALIQACFRFDDASKIIQSLLEHGANPNAKNHRNLTAMHMVFLGLREWLVDTQRKPATEAAKLLLDAGFVGDVKEIAAVLKERGYTDDKIVNTFKQICEDVNMAERLEDNKREYDRLKHYIDEYHIQSEKGLFSRINNILRDQEAATILELEKLKKEKQQEAKQLGKVMKRIELMHTMLEEHAKTMGEAKNPSDQVPMEESKSTGIYNPAIPFHQQAAKLEVNGGTLNFIGIPYTNITVFFKPITINGNAYYISLNKKSEVGSDNGGVIVYNKLSFEVIDVAAKKMFSDIDPKDIDSMLHNLHDQSKDLAFKNKLL